VQRGGERGLFRLSIRGNARPGDIIGRIVSGSPEASRTEGTGGFAVELPVFVGPFKLLADLILDQKIDVCDVSIASVTDRFLARSKEAEGWTLEEATWFLAACAVLLELKVGRLMPRREVLDEEDLLGVSPDLVYARSMELAAFRTVAVELARRHDREALHHRREAGPPREFAHLYPDIMEKLTADELAAAAAAVLRPPPLLDLSHVTPIRYTMAEALAAVRERLGRVGQATFRDLVADCSDRIQVVVRFLALLDLYREGKVDLAQAETFGEIQVRWEGEDGPGEAVG
jgi:segregation and condensation protein A